MFDKVSLVIILMNYYRLHMILGLINLCLCILRILLTEMTDTNIFSYAASIAKAGETSSVLPKPPKTINSSNPSSATTAKRDSMGAGRVKSEGSKLGATSQLLRALSFDMKHLLNSALHYC